MATNTLNPNGLRVSRTRGGSNDFHASLYKIKSGYASAIGVGDFVKTGTGSNQGYIVPSVLADTTGLGVFVGVLPYYDKTLQGIVHGLNGSYQTTANPAADIDCLVYDDALMTFLAQVSGGPFLQSWRGQNINFTSGTNGAPNASGISTLSLDATTIDVVNTLPFKILQVVGITGGPQDPANTNPWIEVRLNTAEILSSTGI